MSPIRLVSSKLGVLNLSLLLVLGLFIHFHYLFFLEHILGYFQSFITPICSELSFNLSSELFVRFVFGDYSTSSSC